VELHDPVLHHLVEALTLGRGDAEGYEAAMQADYGAAGLRLAKLRQAGVFSDRQRYLLPLHQQVLDRARGIIVHSDYAARMLRPSQPVPVRVLRHHASPLVARYDRLDRAAVRDRLGLPQDVPVLLSLGFVTRPKQVEVVLHALARLREEGLDFRYVIGGEAETGLAIADLVERLGLDDRVRLTGFLPEEDFFLYARAADLLLNLRFPLAGESSGTLARALAMGLPALVYEFGPSAEYPEDAVARLPFSREPVPALARAIAALLADRPALARRGEQARAFMRAQCSPGHSADVLLRAIGDWL
jgi:glycosyltransferase involved in cell wall biosynthesis